MAERENQQPQQPQGLEGTPQRVEGSIQSTEEADNRFWDYVIGTGLAVVAVVLAVYAAPLILTIAVAVIAFSFFVEGKPDDNGQRQSLASQLWDSSATIAQNVTNVITWVSDISSSIIFWIILAAFGVWYLTRKESDLTLAQQLSYDVRSIFK